MKEYEVRKFRYNGFMGEILKGYTKYKAEFKEWTTDAGVGVFKCSDGKERLIPTFALDGDYSILPEQPKTGVLFGVSCRS